jgi:predicted MFS family arabinose efflux permease
VSGLAPEHARGLVTGLQGSANTLGGAFATPLTGLLIDNASPAAAVLTVGAVGIALAAVAALATRPSSPRDRSQHGPSAGSQPI